VFDMCHACIKPYCDKKSGRGHDFPLILSVFAARTV
jgi:hypothetical protein